MDIVVVKILIVKLSSLLTLAAFTFVVVFIVPLTLSFSMQNGSGEVRAQLNEREAELLEPLP